MSSVFFNIQAINSEYILVTILSTELTSAYWSDLSNSLSLLQARNKHIVFDLMIRNGFHDRFFIAETDSDSSIISGMRHINVSATIRRKANLFFKLNPEYLDRSVLTVRQRSLLIK